MLLLKADFNTMRMIIFNNRLILNIEAEGLIPIEVIGERKSQSATHLALDKKFILDISNARKVPMIEICIDAANYYDKVVYPFASTCVQYFRIEMPYLVVLLRVIQSIKIFLRAVCRISETCYSREEGRLF